MALRSGHRACATKEQAASQPLDATPLIGTKRKDHLVLTAIRERGWDSPFKLIDLPVPGMKPTEVWQSLDRLADLGLLEVQVRPRSWQLTRDGVTACEALGTLQDVGERFSWESPSGLRTIARKAPARGDGGTIMLVETEGEVLSEFLSPSEVVEAVIRDTGNLASRLRTQQAREEAVAAEAVETAEALDLDGFGTWLSPMGLARAVGALNTQVRNRGRQVTRKALVREVVSRGARLDEHPAHGLMLQSPDGTFFDVKALTRTGMAYAAHLILKRDAQP